MSTLNIRAKPVSERTLYTPSTTTSAPTTTSIASSEEYSYMFPHGTRSAESPRATIDTRFAATPTTATALDTCQTPSRLKARNTK